jgi:hypothetical protein
VSSPRQLLQGVCRGEVWEKREFDGAQRGPK